MFQIKLKAKYRKGGKGQQGYKPNAGNGDSTKRRPNYKKANDAQRKEIQARQPKRIMVLMPNMKIRMENA